MVLKNQPPTNEIIDSSKDHQWMLKSMDYKLLGKQNIDTILGITSDVLNYKRERQLYVGKIWYTPDFLTKRSN